MTEVRVADKSKTCCLCGNAFWFLGDICQQFTKEMFDMYQSYADYKRWTFDIVNYTPAEIGTAVLQRFQDNGIESSVSLLYLSHTLCLSRRFASCCCSYFRRECLQASEIWRRDSPSAANPWDGHVIKNAAYSHWDNVSHCPPSARGGKLFIGLLRWCWTPAHPFWYWSRCYLKACYCFGDFTDNQVLHAIPSKWNTSALTLRADSPWLCTLYV